MTEDEQVDLIVRVIKFHLKPTLLKDEHLQKVAARILINAQRGPQTQMAIIIDLARIYTDGTESNLDTDASAEIKIAMEDIYARLLA